MKASALYIVSGRQSSENYYLMDETNTVKMLIIKNVYYRVGDQIPQSAIEQLYIVKPYVVFKQLLKELL